MKPSTGPKAESNFSCGNEGTHSPKINIRSPKRQKVGDENGVNAASQKRSGMGRSGTGAPWGS